LKESGGVVALARSRSVDHDVKDEDEDEDEDEEFCRCGHDACYHSGHPTVTDLGHTQRARSQLQDALELQRIGYGSVPGRKLSVSTQIDDPALAQALAHTERSANVTAFSAISGTTTERDSTTAGTPMGMPRAPWTTKAASRIRDDASKQSQDVVSYRLDDRLHISPMRLERPPSISSIADKAQLKEGLKQLAEFAHALKNEHMTTQERVEMVEVLPAALEDLAEKVDLMDDHVNEKVDSCETRLKNELDDRLGPIETFFKAQQTYGEKRKRRPLREPSEDCNNSNSVQDNKKRRKRRHEQDPSEAVAAGSHPHGITTTSFTTSFTTTTSSFSSQAATHLPHVNELKLLSEIEMLKTRLLDVEASAPPSVARPWVVEVVLVPAAPLKGIWADAGASIPNTQHTGSETASLPALGRSPNFSQPSGMIPFSFSQKSKAYKRLFSRGFIRRLHITGPTAREVSLSIETNFQDIFEFCSSFAIKSRASSRARSQVRSQASNPSNTSSLSSQRTARGGTRNLWEPLRKIYKQAALEHLPPSDLTSPALWTVDFLKANCMMRGATRRTLYILPRTTGHSVLSNLTWDSIKQLDRFYDHDTQLEVEGEEPYWDFDPKLDARPPLEPGVGSFFSEPLASFGPFAPESDSFVPSPVKLSFSSYLASPQLHQEATPPETAPQLQPRRSSNLNRTCTPPPVPEADKDIPTEDDSKGKRAPRRKRSPRGVVSAPFPRRSTVSPPSPPLSYPQGTRHRKKTASKEPEVHQDRAGSPSPTIEDSPLPTFATSNAMNRNGISLGEMTTMGVGGWQDDSIGGLIHHGWDDAEAEDVAGFQPGVDVETEMDWGSLFGSFDGEEFLRALESEEDQGRDEDQAAKSEDDEADDDDDADLQTVNAQLLTLPAPSAPVGISHNAYGGDGGYHSD
jgi:hypothetical protein